MPGLAYGPCLAGSLYRSELRNCVGKHGRTQALTDHLNKASAPPSGSLKL